MRAKQLNAVVIQRYSPIYMGDDNPQFPRSFQPTHNSHLVKQSNLKTENLFKSISEKQPQSAQNTNPNEQAEQQSSTPLPQVTKQATIESSLDYLEYVMNMEKEKEEQRVLVAKRLRELKARNQKKVEVEVSTKETESYLQDLLNQINQINLQKQPYRMLFFRTDSSSALLKIKQLNDKLKPLIEQLFQKMTGATIDTFESVETTKKLVYFRELGEFQGHSTKELLQILSSSLKMLSQQERQWNLHKATVPPSTNQKPQ